ncbi:hypothetical protein LY474_00725 [Myxococcus stipitatus]|uniref:hypothetical protein n=1 Tax=Myxococcus stipitatus TaxID=83455 RepID=UPI001F1CA682|nr:hypothetical protein [Myxococcus stipitatus]MCE9666322.1 hypothetical protein [Myxococcus stipitatus]
MLPKDLTECFLPFKVEVAANQFLANGVQELSFYLVNEQPRPSSPYTLQLQLEQSYVWPDLPSTAQLGKAGEFGFLFLSPTWLRKKGLVETLAEGGGKWPIGADAPVATVLALFKSLQEDDSLHQRVQGLMADIRASKG